MLSSENSELGFPCVNQWVVRVNQWVARNERGESVCARVGAWNGLRGRCEDSRWGESDKDSWLAKAHKQWIRGRCEKISYVLSKSRGILCRAGLGSPPHPHRQKLSLFFSPHFLASRREFSLSHDWQRPTNSMIVSAHSQISSPPRPLRFQVDAKQKIKSGHQHRVCCVIDAFRSVTLEGIRAVFHRPHSGTKHG